MITFIRIIPLKAGKIKLLINFIFLCLLGLQYFVTVYVPKHWIKYSVLIKLKTHLKDLLKLKKQMKEKDNDMSIEISNDYYANDYDDISEKQTNESVDDSDDDAAETFGY